jgi:glycosyltransferase involved in cell wall biosynthesis
MRILFLTSGPQVPSSRFRVLQYIPYLRDRGHECVVLPSRPAKYRSYRCLGHRFSSLIRRHHRTRELVTAKPEEFDIVFLERELFSDASVDLEAAFRTRARSLVWDVDDGLFVLHPAKFDHLAKMCDLAIVGNAFLQDRVEALECAAVRIPTVVDLSRFTQKSGEQGSTDNRPNKPVALGWTGTAANIEYLGLISGPLRRLAEEHAFELVVIAERMKPLRKLDLHGVPVRFVQWSEEREIEDLRQFDIGLMPMPDSEWTRYKCGLKIIQYMALRVPAVASPVGVNRDLITHGTNGFLADSIEQWFRTLERLIQEPELRGQVGNSGYQTVRESYSVDANLDKFVDALKSVCE